MLGILFIYFIGKFFYKLAEDFKQNKWLYAVLGVVIYYAAGAVVGVILGLADGLLSLGIDWENTTMLSLIAIPVGLGADLLVYQLLRRKWQREFAAPIDEISSIGEENPQR